MPNEWDNLPELTPEEQAAMDQITPDFMFRLIGGDNTPERACKDVDELARHQSEGRCLTPSEQRLVGRRYLMLLECVTHYREGWIDAKRQLIASQR